MMLPMVYVKVAHGVWVDWKTILGGQRGNCYKESCPFQPMRLWFLSKSTIFVTLNTTILHGTWSYKWLQNNLQLHMQLILATNIDLEENEMKNTLI